MKATVFIRKIASENDTNSVATIYFKLRDGERDIKTASELIINPNHWSSERQGYKDRVTLVSEEEKQALNNEARNILNPINQNYAPESDSEWLSTLIDKYHYPNRYKTKKEIETENKSTLLELFSEFFIKYKLSEVRKKNFRVIQRTLIRYELYIRATEKGQKGFILDVGTVTPEMLWDTWGFFENEYQYCELYPNTYEAIPEKRTPQPCGRNALIDCFSRIRTFFLWCFDNKLTANRPSDRFPIEEYKYGTPIYIDLEERDRIFNTDLSVTPQLEIQRDIFIF